MSTQQPMSPEEQALRQHYASAESNERARWEQVRGHYPGQPGHDAAAWAEWLAAAKLLKTAALRLRELVRTGG